MKANKGNELHKLDEICKQHIWAIQLSEYFNLDTFLAMAMELKVGEVTSLKWMEYSNDSQNTPLYSELFEFLDKQAWLFKSVTSE